MILLVTKSFIRDIKKGDKIVNKKVIIYIK